jgi:uncharacterized RDD family membrane protein YckC
MTDVPHRHPLTAQAQRAAAVKLHGAGADTAAPPPYAGLVTRAIAFAVDALAVNVSAGLVGAIVALGLSILNVPDQTDTVLLALGGVLYVVWTVAYFVIFWSTTGQTPGDRLMQIRVIGSATGEPIRPGRAVIRMAGVTLAAIPLLAGFLPILFDRSRRGLQDFMARTVVVHVPPDREAMGR